MRAVDWGRIRRMELVLASILLAFTASAQTPDTIYYNAHIITVASNSPSAQAVAIVGDRFAAIGGNDEVLKTAGPNTRKIDLGGKCIVPGIIESHVHPIGAALSEIDGPVPLLHSIPEIQAYIREQAKKTPPDRLIFVPKVYSTRLAERRYPTRFEVDSAAPGREAMLDNGYAAVLSSALLKKAGITRDTPQPENGRIAKDAKGELTGLILGAPELLRPFRGARRYTDKDRLWALKSMLQRYNSVGITSIYDRSEGPEGFRAYEALHKAGELTARSTVTYLISAAGAPGAGAAGDRTHPLRHRLGRRLAPRGNAESRGGRRNPDRNGVSARAVRTRTRRSTASTIPSIAECSRSPERTCSKWPKPQRTRLADDGAHHRRRRHRHAARRL